MIDFNEVYNDSYERIAKDADRFFHDFYDIFIAKSATIKKMFARIDMDRQRDMLQDSFYYLVTFFSTKQAGERMFHLARVHRNLMDISPDMYELWLEALLETVARHDDKFNNTVEVAWRVVLAPGIEFMKHHQA